MTSPQIVHHKHLLRNKLRQKIARLTRFDRRKKSEKVQAKVLKTLAFQQSKNVLIYASLLQEVDTGGLILESLRRGKNTLVPRVDARKKKISAVKIENPKTDLKRGHYGILEPKNKMKRTLSPGRLDLILVPGLGFDRRGARLGRGAGFFDRFLKRAKHAKKIALAFREQIVKRIPTESHDILMDRVITD